MNTQQSAMNLKWEVHEGQLTPLQLNACMQLLERCENITSSCLPYFNLEGVKLCNGQQLIYLLGFNHSTNMKPDSSASLEIALPLVRETKSFFGIKFILLKPVSHDHVDMMSILGQETFPALSWLPSLKKALKINNIGWDLISARRLRINDSVKNKYISPIYVRQSAFLSFYHKNDRVGELGAIIPKKLLKNIARFERKIESEQKTELNLDIYQDEGTIEEGLSEFFRLEASGWKGEAGSAISSDTQLERFYRNCWKEFAKNNMAEIFVLRSGNKAIASGIAFQSKTETILHKIAFDETLSKYGPGSILVKKIVEITLADVDKKSICFNTNPKWLARWHTKKYHLHAIQCFNTSFKGLVLKLIFNSLDHMRLLKRRLKQSKN